MPRIPEETIQRVLDATDIVDLVGRYVKLKRAGTDYKGLCPFHTEKSPSFSVSPTRKTYHCFGCHAGGHAIRFLMEHDGLQFVEAVKRLADAAGIRIEEEAWDPNAEREAKQRAVLKEVHKEIAEFYHQLLLRNQAADPARQYLKSRGFSSAMAKSWQMGYAPEPSTGLLRQWAAEHKYSPELLREAGILAQSDDGRLYPRLRHRLMFPIRDENGAVVAFSGRVLSPDQKGGKYVNSPETPIFSKSKVLFGFDKSKRAIAKAGKAIVCEGQLDIIAAFEAGVQNVVAPLGTAFTEQHAKMLKRLTEEVVLCFDSDAAGVGAAEKSYKILSPAGLVVRVASLPKGEDPDSMIRKHGPEAFVAQIDKAVDFLDFQIAHKRAAMGTDMGNQVQLIEQTAVTIAMNPSMSARELMIQSHAGQLGIGEEALRRQVNEFVKRRAKGEEKEAKAAAPTTGDEARKILAAQHKNALLLTGMAITDPEVLEWLRNQDLDELHHDFPGTDMLHRLWMAHFQAGEDSAFLVFLTSLSAAEEAAFSILRARPKDDGGMPKAKQVLDALQTERLVYLMQRARAAMKQPDVSPERISELHQQVDAWNKEYLDRRKPAPDSP